MILGKNYFWIYIVSSVIIFAGAVFVIPKIIRFLEKITKKKDTPKKLPPREKKRDYKTF